MTEVRRIHHFEDEPELVKWIPGALLNLYWRRHPEWIARNGDLDEFDRRSCFFLLVNGTEWQIEYRFYRTRKEFDTDFTAAAQVSDVALIDLMDAKQHPIGLAVFEKAVEVLGAHAVYYLTSFPGEIKERGGVPESHVLTKPEDVAEIAELLLEKLAVR